MKLTPAIYRDRGRQRAWALLAVMTLSACGLMVLASVMNWADQNAANTARHNEYFATSYAAEAATEKVLSQMCQQFERSPSSAIGGGLTGSAYTSFVPSATVDGIYWNSYLFTGSNNVGGQIIVSQIWTNWSNIPVASPYSGLTMLANGFEIIASAENTNTGNHIVATVGQQVNLGLTPLFQFAIFYQDDMELAPNASMTVTGTVHGNANIYAEPATNLTFEGAVSASGQVLTNEESTNDKTPRLFGTVNFDATNLSGVDPLNLPVGTNTSGSATNVGANVYGILEPPQAGQPYNGNLLYNQADMIIIISNNGAISVTSGVGNNQATVINNNQWQTFMNTNASGQFNDQWNNDAAVKPVVIDVGQLVQWSATNTVLRPVLGGSSFRDNVNQADVQSIYVADLRPITTFLVTNYTTNSHSGRVSSTVTTESTQPGLVLSNGAVLPPQGLSIATPDPAYIVGNWNIAKSTNAGAPSDAGTNDTYDSLASAIYADAITVLSPAWNPANSMANLTNRNATSDTVNAAFLAGNVPSTNGTYSGGVENFPRLLENWTGQTFTYNGSMVCMFPSQIATNAYPGPGTVYNQPQLRNWAYDTNYSNPANQPPMTPSAVTVQRGQWVLLTPYASWFPHQP